MELNIYKNISLQDKNWFKTGGNAKFFCEPENSIQMSEAIKSANNASWPIFMLGQGAKYFNK